ncbi:MAG: hypothetical protein EXR84_03800 [Gammaproteobacteria bacterium]|nr:hypothetical protein [Gammaproteobacteria bacterium]
MPAHHTDILRLNWMAAIAKLFTAILCRSILLTAALGSSVSFAQQVTDQAAALYTPWGHPDLQGVWDRRTITPLERPERFADKAILSADEIIAYERASAARDDGRPLDFARSGISVHDPADLDYGSTVLATGQTSLVVDPPNGRVPALTDAARARIAAQAQAREGRGPADSWLDRSLTERCLTWGVPQGMLPQAYNNNIQIVQTPNEVLILNEMVHDVRIVPLDGRPHIPAAITQWHGDPKGHWEGDTLVVESTNFSPQAEFQRSGANLQLVERFRRTGPQTLAYEFTVQDASTWVQPWTVAFPMTRTDQPVYEFACHEGNYGLKNILGAARVLELESTQSQ